MPDAAMNSAQATSANAQVLKERGNEAFKNGDWDNAAALYTDALNIGSLDREFRATLLKNRAAVNLKLKDFGAAEEDCSRALELIPNDSKALFRRSQAREEQNNVFEAFKDAKMALHFENNNKAILQALERLAPMVKKKQAEADSTEHKVKEMLRYAFDSKGTSMERRIQAMNNVLVMARERLGAALLWQSGVVDGIIALLKDDGAPTSEEYGELVLAAQRVLDELCRDHERMMMLTYKLPYRDIVRLLDTKDQKLSDAASVLVQRSFNAIANMDKHEGKKPDEALCEKNKVELVRLIFELKSMLTDPGVGAIGRNNAMDMLTRNLMHMDGGLPRGWSWKFMRDDGLERLLKVACCVPQKAAVPVVAETRDHLAVCLTKLYEDCIFDQYRAEYKEICEKFMIEEMKNASLSGRAIRIAACCTTLMLGPFEVGVSLIASQGITDLLLEMADSDDILEQTVAAEAIVQTASKRDRCSALLASGVPVLKQLYLSKNDHVRARALVGLCKLAASGGTDASRKAMAEGSTLELAKQCKKLLLNAAKDVDLRRWAAEGLSYVTLDADVKELLVQDASTIRALVELAKQAGPLCVYAVAAIFVSLTNMYERPNPDPELVKLAQFAKHHVPEEDLRDSEEFVKKRVNLLVKEGATSGCVALGNTESQQSTELLARSLFAFCKEREHRGTVVQEGGAKLLVKLATGINNTEACKTHAAQALAKIAIVMDPNIAFPGQRAYEVVKPLVSLLHVDMTGLQNYEGLLALTNLASMSDSMRKRIVKEKVLPKLEEYWFMQEHEDLRAAAAECLLNLLYTKEGMDLVLAPKTDRLKLWLLYCGEDDERLVRASAGGLVLVTEHKEACERLVNEVGSWRQILRELSMHEDMDIQLRGLMAINNMMASSYDVAAKIVQDEVFDVLVAIAKQDDATRAQQKKVAGEILNKAEKWELIKPTERELFERKENN